MNLSTEEREELKDLVTQDSYKALVKVMRGAVEVQENSVNNYNLLGGSEREFINRKLELDGARKLVKSVLGYVAQLRKNG